ncbi:MAG: hypothetical protein JNK75_07410 [Betaproteobacteria bacterium]|nr:hypothetical protein [Betaproteobacteria bacterium]
MTLKSVRWGLAVLALLLCYLITVACAFGWVAIYGHLIHPGQPDAHYHAYAQLSTPWVALITGIPVFFGAGWWIARKATENPTGTALAMVLLYLAVDFAFLAGAPAGSLPVALMAANLVCKVAAVFAGCAWARRARAAP